MSNTEEVGASLALHKPISPKMRLGQSFVVMPHGLAVEGQPSLDEWLEVGTLLNKADTSVRWWRGDWLAYGEKAYGQTYEEAMEKLGLSYSTLSDERYVASHVQFSVRTENLSWMHHKVVAPLPIDQQQYWLNYAEEHQLKPPELRDKIKGAERLSWLRYTDVWNFSECDRRFGIEYPGRIPGQIVQNVLYYYTKPGDFIIDPMAGGGTTRDVCTKCEETKRDCLSFDNNPQRSDILKHDAAQPWPTNKEADLVFIDPPYGSQLENDYGGMAQEPLPVFLSKMELIFQQACQYLKENGLLAILIAPMAIKTEYVDLPFLFCQKCAELGFTLKRRIAVPVGNQQIGPQINKECKETRTLMAVMRDLLVLKK